MHSAFVIDRRRLLAGLAVSPLPLRVVHSAEANPDFTFALVTDTHLGLSS